jgi:hypothetical protein
MNTSKIDALALAAETRAESEKKARALKAAGGAVKNGSAFVSVRPSDAEFPAKISSPRIVSSKNSRKPTFAHKLHAMLSDRNLGSIITWLPSGKSFCIMNKEAFTRKILPTYFKESKFESFSRRLKRWGFTKVYTASQKKIVITHELFQNGRLDLCQMMNARASQGSQAVTRGAASALPDAVKRELALAEQTLQAHQQSTQDPKIQLKPKSSSPQVQLRLPQATSPPMTTYRPAPAYPQYQMSDVYEMPMSTYYAFEVDRATNYWHPSARPPSMTRVNMSDIMFSLDREIQDCQEQLDVLRRLRDLREKRRVLC